MPVLALLWRQERGRLLFKEFLTYDKVPLGHYLVTLGGRNVSLFRLGGMSSGPLGKPLSYGQRMLVGLKLLLLYLQYKQLKF